MIDRVINQNLNQQQESFYFQLIPISLTLVNKQSDLPAAGTTYRFSVHKGIISSIQVHKNSIKIVFPFLQNSLSQVQVSMPYQLPHADSIFISPLFRKEERLNSR